MLSKELKDIVLQQRKISEDFWKDRPSATKEEIDAVSKFSEKKLKEIDQFFNSPEKIKQIEQELSKK